MVHDRLHSLLPKYPNAWLLVAVLRENQHGGTGVCFYSTIIAKAPVDD